MNINATPPGNRLDESLSIEPRAPTVVGRQADPRGGPAFKDVLAGIVDQVDTLQKDADRSIQGLATGETRNVHDVTIKMEEAGVAFDLMMEIRNKLVDAYQQLMRMQQ
jgi:flagellar hook-basal body complex protein FliE